MVVKPLLILTLLCSAGFSAVHTAVVAKSYSLPPSNQRLIGEPTQHQVVSGDYFQRLAEQYNVGFLALIAANPGVDPFLTYQKPSGNEVYASLKVQAKELDKAVNSEVDGNIKTEHSRIHIPTQLLLPFVERKGVVINLPELRLYYFQPEQNKVHVFPVGIGRKGLAMLNLTSYIGEKRKAPIWRPSEEMKARYLAEKGAVLADEIPPGPTNPFGKYALRLATSEYLIHGTNQRFGIGTRAGYGCIRMYDDDIKWLYDNVALNTPVKIIDQPVKMSYEKPGLKLFEVHQPLTSSNSTKQLESGWQTLTKFIGAGQADRYRSDYDAATGLVVRVEKVTSATTQVAE
ncbi:peptidoglycan-binding protein [Thalassotalea euphylliae]|uniref:Peptidoglycan-binding protein n=1 Tax=Thalassotalea euphylliae TaxID=1655234 RepID=A0A3E0TU33_9GAMM|nr:L,D-transpeptidase family protein [Thalassotalea euphylliae]REL27960.1 peptidoglycan-binding protein [Thalassotalea euphylliae]